MLGRRVHGKAPHELEPGDCGRWDADKGNWYACVPDGKLANLTAHSVVEHSDGSITVSPSILVSQLNASPEEWALLAGAWRVEVGMTPRDYALLAQEAYAAPPDIGVADSASRAIVRHTADGLCIAFRGTDDLASFAADFDISPLDVAGVGKVFKGFWDAWDAISLPVLAAAAGQPVTLTGHSLGAAIALMCAAYMTVGGNPPAAVWGFEPPRVGCDLGVRNVLASVPVHLFRNGNDVVTDLPPGGQHAALLTPIGKAAFPFANLTDHEIARVIAALPTS